MKKLVLDLGLLDDKKTQKAMGKVSGMEGIKSIKIDKNDKKLTVTGDVDAVKVVTKLKKLCGAKIVTLEDVKEEKPKEEKPKEEKVEWSYSQYPPWHYHPWNHTPVVYVEDRPSWFW